MCFNSTLVRLRQPSLATLLAAKQLVDEKLLELLLTGSAAAKAGALICRIGHEGQNHVLTITHYGQNAL
jgi:hypothetical protein